MKWCKQFASINFRKIKNPQRKMSNIGKYRRLNLTQSQHATDVHHPPAPTPLCFQSIILLIKLRLAMFHLSRKKHGCIRFQSAIEAEH